MSIEVSALIKELATLSQHELDGNARDKALHLSKKLTIALQKPEDAAIELSLQPMFAAAARTAIDLKLFHLIAESPVPVSLSELATASGAVDVLIARLLRPLSALNFVQEEEENVWSATSITRAMCLPPIQASFVHFWDQGNTSGVKMHTFFKETGYRQPEDPRNGLFQYALGTDKEAFEYWHTLPNVLDNFNTAMTGIRGSRPSWIEWWPVQERILDQDVDENSVLLVDIAGGRGHDVEAFGRKFSNRKGRLILQDLQIVVQDIQQLDSGIEKMEYDFLTPQPVQGARVYFFHFILHDWSDDVCRRILAQTTAAMKKGYSKLILNEFILPKQDCPLFPAGFDLQMMTMHAAQERTESQWLHLLESAGLRVVQFWQPSSGGEGIIEAELR